MAELKMPDINNVLIAGYLTSDPIYRKTSTGTSVVNFYIASNRKYRDNSGIWRENICYVGIVAWHNLADTCHEILKKGGSVLIDGELQSRSWKNEDGSVKNIVEIRARRIQFLDRKAPKEVEEMTANQESLEQASGSDVEKIKTTQENQSTGDIKVEPTDFDFGYQNLNI